MQMLEKTKSKKKNCNKNKKDKTQNTKATGEDASKVNGNPVLGNNAPQTPTLPLPPQSPVPGVEMVASNIMSADLTTPAANAANSTHGDNPISSSQIRTCSMTDKNEL